MASEVEAAGAAVTAGLAAAAIDGVKGRGKDAPHGPCPNCGAPLAGNYCARCGQPAHIHASLKQIVGDVFRDIFHFDTRAWKTLPSLVFRPGTLTRQYIDGHRARYISPLAMFLLAVFAMFFVFSTMDDAGPGIVANDDGSIQLDTSGLAAVEVRSQQAQAELEELTERGASSDDIEKAREQAEDAREDLERLRDIVAAARVDDNSPMEEIRKDAASGDMSIETGWKLLDAKVAQSLENPQLAIYKIQDAASKYAFLLAPISLPFVWLLFFWKRGVTLFDHTVYILYSLSFVALLGIVISGIERLPPTFGVLTPILLVAGVVHAFFQLKGGYGLGWFSAAWRLPFLLAFAGLSLLIFVLAVIVLGVVA